MKTICYSKLFILLFMGLSGCSYISRSDANLFTEAYHIHLEVMQAEASMDPDDVPDQYKGNKKAIKCLVLAQANRELSERFSALVRNHPNASESHLTVIVAWSNVKQKMANVYQARLDRQGDYEFLDSEYRRMREYNTRSTIIKEHVAKLQLPPSEVLEAHTASE